MMFSGPILAQYTGTGSKIHSMTLLLATRSPKNIGRLNIEILTQELAMKLFFALFTTLFVMMMYMAPADAKPHKPKASYTYRVELGDVGRIETKAPTKQKAFKSAAIECFDRRLAQYENLRGKATDDRKMDFIDACANIPY